MTKKNKKRSSEILEDRWEFFGKMHKFFGETPKKIVQKFRQKFGTPVSEGLDPLVHAHVAQYSIKVFWNIWWSLNFIE